MAICVCDLLLLVSVTPQTNQLPNVVFITSHPFLRLYIILLICGVRNAVEVI